MRSEAIKRSVFVRFASFPNQICYNNLDHIENAILSPKKRFDGTTVLVKISTPDGKYGVAFEHMPKGRNIITTAFKDSDGNIDNWIKENSAKAMQTAPTTQKGLLSSRSMSDIVANLDDNVNIPSYQLPPKAYKDGKAGYSFLSKSDML